MTKSDLHAKGMAIRTELLGEDYVARMNQKTYEDPVMQKFREIAAENQKCLPRLRRIAWIG